MRPAAGRCYRMRKLVRRHPGRRLRRWSSSVAALALVGLFVLVYRQPSRGNKRRAASHLRSLAVAITQPASDLFVRKLKKVLEEDANSNGLGLSRFLYVSPWTLAERPGEGASARHGCQLLRSVIPVRTQNRKTLGGFEWWHLRCQHHGEQSRLRGHTEAVTVLAFSSDDRLLASGSADMTVRLWELRNRQRSSLFEGSREVSELPGFQPRW